MALTTTHGMLPTTICLSATVGAFGCTPTTVAIGAVTSLYAAYHSMKPDMIGLRGGSAHGHWDAYVSAHHGEILAQVARQSDWRPSKWLYLFHIWTDQFFHRDKAPYGWKPEGYVYESFLTFGLFAVYFFAFDWTLWVGVQVALWLYYGTGLLGEKKT